MSQPRKSFKTEKGTELPLISLKGKEYLQVMHRLVWFKEKYAEGKGLIRTQMLANNGQGPDEYFIFRAEIYIETDKGHVLVATGHKRETVGSFADAMEKSETGAIGRALAMLGIGTQFAADDLDEGSRLADAPAPVLEKTLELPFATKAVMTPDMVTSNLVDTPKRPSFRKPTNSAPSATTGNDI